MTTTPILRWYRGLASEEEIRDLLATGYIKTVTRGIYVHTVATAKGVREAEAASKREPLAAFEAR